ncbi:MAG TPA: hypothetical protein VN408_32050, partial [Actinoplanes sp.]|nr:hypothetical protein [Actinoplanes sp.]
PGPGAGGQEGHRRGGEGLPVGERPRLIVLPNAAPVDDGGGVLFPADVLTMYSLVSIFCEKFCKFCKLFPSGG